MQRTMALPALAGIAAFAVPAAAQVHNRTNSGGGNWNTPGNWSPSVPNGLTHTASLTATGTYTITLDAHTTEIPWGCG